MQISNTKNMKWCHDDVIIVFFPPIHLQNFTLTTYSIETL